MEQVTLSFTHTLVPMPQALVVELRGRLDSGAAPGFEASVRKSVANGYPVVLFDLERLDFLCSSGLRVLLRTAEQVKPSGGSVAVCSPGRLVADVLRVSGVDRIVPVRESRSAALAALGS